MSLHPNPTHKRTLIPEGFELPSMTGGNIRVRGVVHRADISNNIGKEIEIEGGTIDIDLDRPIKGTCRLETAHPSLLPAWSWVAPFLEIIPEVGTPKKIQVGLYQMGQPDGRAEYGWTRSGNSGSDITAVLHRKRLEDTLNFYTGTKRYVALNFLANMAGLTRFYFPVNDSAFTEVKSFKAGSSIWECMTEITSSLGWYAPLATNTGLLTSFPYRKRDRQTAARIYRIGEDARVLRDISIDRDDASFANVVVAVSENVVEGTVMTAVARNDDPNSRFSTTHPEGPGEVYAPTLVKNEIEDQDVLQATAEEDLASRAISANITLQLMPDPTLTVHDVIGIETDLPHMFELRGYWGLQQISYSLHDGIMTAKARRSETNGGQ